jgi:hypothetical protein
MSVDTLTKEVIALSGLIIFLLFFFLVPVVSFSCSNGLFTTTGSVSLSCEAFGFGEIHEFALGISESGWSDDCQIINGATVQCTAGLAAATLLMVDTTRMP